MNQKELIKYGLLALGAYLIWKYVQDHGGLESVLGMNSTALPKCATGQVLDANGKCIVPAATDTTTHTNTIQPVSLDTSGLTVHADVNDSLTGAVKINGVPMTLSIITLDGRIFNTSGQEISASLQGQGIDVAALRNAFSAAGSGLSGYVPTGWGSAWVQ